MSNTPHIADLPPAALRAASLRLAGIQGLRFVAALMVVIYHANIFVNDVFPRPADDPIMMFSLIGAAGVPVFFTISGFIMFHTSGQMFHRPGATADFLKRRLLRVYPIYWIILLFYLLKLAWWGPGVSAGPADLAWIALLVPGYADSIISPAWTLVYELYFYITFGLVLALPKRIGLAVIFLLFTGGIAIGKIFDLDVQNPVIEVLTNPVLLEFLAGLCIGLSVAHAPLAKAVLRPWLVRVLLFSAVTGFILIPFLRPLHLPAVLVLGVPSVLIVAWAIAAEYCDRLSPVMTRLAPLGDSSYSLYLIHILVMSLCMPFVRFLVQIGVATPLGLMVLLTAVSLLAGIAVHRWIERPVYDFLRQRLTHGRNAGFRPGLREKP